MHKEFSYGIIPLYKNEQGEYEVLLIKHKGGIGHRAFPKGHIEDGETPLQAAQREFTEETGIHDIQLYKERIFKDHYTFTGRKHISLLKEGEKSQQGEIEKFVGYYIGFITTKDVKVQDEEIDDFAWLSIAKARDRLTFDSGKHILDKARKVLQNLSLPMIDA
jgi:8-oxo-dGTP pyrophosphatase MutT (NUDIX family)